jgi:hypothetical protein
MPIIQIIVERNLQYYWGLFFEMFIPAKNNINSWLIIIFGQKFGFYNAFKIANFLAQNDFSLVRSPLGVFPLVYVSH